MFVEYVGDFFIDLLHEDAHILFTLQIEGFIIDVFLGGWGFFWGEGLFFGGLAYHR